MRTLAVTQNATVDGAIDMLDPWFDPQGQADDAELMAITKRDSNNCDALLLGRETFEAFRGYWPQQQDDRTGVSDELQELQKYVVSSTMTDPEWQNSTVLSGDPVEAVRELKAQPGKDIVVTGSVTLSHALIQAGVVDEFRILTFPAVQGRGRRFFPDGYVVPQLRLLETQTFDSGITYVRYAPQEES